jgi:hypothetical protein
MARRKTRSRSRKPSLPTQAGIGWYDAVQWAKLKQVAADLDELGETHEAWQRNAEQAERQLATRGLVLRRIPIDVDALVKWCREHNKQINGKARAEYTSMIVRGEISS